MRRIVIAAAATAVMGLVPATASADQRGPVTVRTPGAAGPSTYDRVRLIESGPKAAKRVLVLMPGTSAGAGNTALVGEALAARLKGWQVWSVSRRETLLEDHATMEGLTKGTVTPQAAFDYYLGWVGNAAITDHVKIPTDDEVAFTREWGMRTAVQDLRAVIRRARKGGRKVVLGGHSLGATIAMAYATWDFGGRAGAKDLDGLLLLDGGSSRTGLDTAAAAREALEQAKAKSPFLDLSGTGLPWTVGVFGELGAALARIEPTAPSKLQSWPLLPAALKPPVPATSRASFGFAVDGDTGPANLALAQMTLGGLAESGEPRDWVEGGFATVDRGAQVFTNPILGGTSWLHPSRLSLDGGAVAGGVRNPAQSVLGLRTWRGKQAKLPLYAYETSLGKGRVLAGARALAKRAGTPRRWTTYVDRSTQERHLDPLADAPATNAFVKTVVPFLKRVQRRR